MKTIAIIPARGGSKRIPRKNIKIFIDKPIIAYSIEAALKSNIFDEVIVSTDDEEIAAVSREHGAETPFFRPASLADDHATTDDVIRHAITWLRDHNHAVEYLCCIYATAPFICPEYIIEGHQKLINSDKHYAFSITRYPFPIQRALRMDANGKLETFFQHYTSTRSQDLEEAYHDAGQFYWGRAESFLAGEEVYSPQAIPIILPRFMVQDIDTEEDWLQAELMYLAWRSRTGLKP